MIQEPRPVHFRTIIASVKKRPILLRVSAIYLLTPILMILIFGVIFSVGDDVPVVDHSRVNELGKPTLGTITGIETQYNITINDQHPSVISYTYDVDGNSLKSKFKTLSTDKVNRLHTGDSIDVKYLNGKSTITSLPPFEFPRKILFTILAPFLLIGLICSSYLFIVCRNEIRLYKFGAVVEAEVIAMDYKAGLPIYKMGRGIKLHYQYKTNHSRNYLGKSFTSDVSLLNALKQGDSIKIFVSLEDESKSILIPRLEAIRNNWKTD